jgi:putative DNA primase/helicase
MGVPKPLRPEDLLPDLSVDERERLSMVDPAGDDAPAREPARAARDDYGEAGEDQRVTITIDVASIAHPEGNGEDREQARWLAHALKREANFDHDSDVWLIYDPESGLWRPDTMRDLPARIEHETIARIEWIPTRYVEDRAKILVRNYRRILTMRGMTGALDWLSGVTGYKSGADEWDRDPHLVGCANGVLDLRTLKLLSPDEARSKRVSMSTGVAYDANAQCPKFLDHMALVQPDKDMREYLLRTFGYMLTGETGEQVWWFWYGPSAFNGKTQTVDAIRLVLGDYGMKGQQAVFIKNPFRNPINFGSAIHKMRRARLVDLSELSKSGGELDAAFIKDLVEGKAGAITYRPPYGRRDITAHPPSKLIGHGNTRPDVGDSTDGFWRRTTVIPWTEKVPPDKRIADYGLWLASNEGAGILALLAREAHAYYRDGLLALPGAAVDASAEYRANADHFALWLNDAVIVTRKQGDMVPASAVLKAYTDWCWNNGIKDRKVLDGADFKSRLETTPGVSWKRMTMGSFYLGLTIANVASAAPAAEDDQSEDDQS